MQVLGLMLMESKGINDVHRRAYTTHVTGETFNQLDQATQGGRNLSQLAISQVAADILKPSAESEGVAGIVNGWQTSRYHFVLKLLETESNGSSNIAYYIGFTDYSDGAYVTLSGNRIELAGDLQFHVSSVHRLRNSLHIGAGGTNTVAANKGSHQLFFSNSANDMHSKPSNTFLMRPSDVFSSQDTLTTLSRHNLLDNGLLVNDTTGSLVGGGEQSNRQNNAPGTYLYNTLKAYNYASAATEGFGDDLNAFTTEAMAHTRDGTLFYDPFFSHMAHFNMQVRNRGQFSYRDLKNAFPHVDEITTVSKPNASSQVWDYTNTEKWNGSNMETVAAALLANAVPSILLDNLGSEIRFSMTNATAGGVIVRQPMNFQPIDATAAIARETMCERVLDRIEAELIPTISMHGAIPFFILMDVSVTGDTMVSISLNNGPQTPYVMPTFADNLASPVMTTDSNRYLGVTNDIYSIATQLLDKKPTAPQIITNPNQPMQPMHPQQPIQPAQQPMVMTGIQSSYNTKSYL